MFCVKCGQKLPDDALFCSRCRTATVAHDMPSQFVAQTAPAAVDNMTGSVCDSDGKNAPRVDKTIVEEKRKEYQAKRKVLRGRMVDAINAETESRQTKLTLFISIAVIAAVVAFCFACAFFSDEDPSVETLWALIISIAVALALSISSVETYRYRQGIIEKMQKELDDFDRETKGDI